MMEGYKETPIGLIPENWEATKISALCNVRRGASPRPINDTKWWGGTVGWVRISDATSTKKYLKKTRDSLSQAGVQKSVQIPQGEVILSICATIGKPVIMNMDACIHDGFVWFENLDESIQREYFFYFLLSKQNFLASNRQTGTQGNLNTSIVGHLAFPVPPSIEQSKIASILSTVDEKIDSINQRIEETQKLKQGLMQKLLTRGIGHTRFKDSPLGEIPESWEVCRIVSFLSEEKGAMKIGPFGSQLKKDSMVGAGIKVYGQENIFRKDMGFGDRFITKEHYNQLKSCELHPGDFIISMMGTIGKCMVVPNDIEKGIMDSHLIRLQLNKSRMLPSFLMQFFGSSFLLNQVEKLAHGGIMDGLSSAIVNQIKFILPPISEQEKFSTILENADYKIYALHLKKTKYEQLKKGLMQQLLTGKIRVNIDN